jgi:hypothetical protein
MRSFPTQKILVRAYWRKLTSSIGAAYKSGGGRVSARRATHGLQTRQGRAGREQTVAARERLDSAFIK